MTNSLEMLPFNISLLILTPDNLRGLRQIKALDIFLPSSKEFHPDGLFSVDIFGKIGDERRNRLYAYIDLNLPILHPVIYKAIVDLKELYGKIMAGTAYAVFNSQTKDFDASTMVEGKTGYAFFMEHFPQLVFEERKSTSREFAIKMVNKYRSGCLMDKMVVMPAGLRDFTIQPNGKPEEDEINGLYRKILSISNVIGSQGKNADLEHLNSTRNGLQLAVVDIYNYIVNLLEGKSKMIQGWWTNRMIFQSTRNVITSNVPTTKELDDPTTIRANDTVVGLYQTLRCIFPLAVNLVREIASQVFAGPNSPATVVNKKTLMKEQVQISPDHYDEWMTQEGLESIFGRFEIELLRQDPIDVGGYWLGLLYNDGKRVKFFQGLDELPEGFDKQYAAPITYAELFYLAIFQRVKKTPCFVTRYPVTGYGSIYPSYIYLKTTTKSSVVEVLGPSWESTGVIANEFPMKGIPFVNSMSPNEKNLTRLTADGPFLYF